MRIKAVFAVLGVLVSVALMAWLVGPGIAQDDRKNGGVVRAGDAVIDGAGIRIEDGPWIDGAGIRIGEDGSGKKDSSVGVENEEDRESTLVGDGEAVLKLRGDDGVEFSGTCFVGGEEQEIEGQVPEEFTFRLDGEELECKIRKEGNDGTLKMILLSGNSRSVQTVSGDSTLKLNFSESGASSSTNSVSSNGSVSQSSSNSSVVRSSSSSTGE